MLGYSWVVASISIGEPRSETPVVAVGSWGKKVEAKLPDWTSSSEYIANWLINLRDRPID